MTFFSTLIMYLFIELSRESMLFSTNHKYIYYLLIIGTFLLLSIFVYYFLYKHLKEEFNIFSYLSFTSFLLILLLYVKGIYYLFFCHKYNMPPLLLENLSVFSQYRYMVLTLFSVFFALLWFLSFYISSFKKIIDMISYPFVKEEIRKLLYHWHLKIFGPACNFFYNKLLKSKLFSTIFFTLHFMIFYLFRLIICCLLINFVFFKGNLYNIIYLLPISFFIWFLGFFDYYFKTFREGTSVYILELLEVNYKKSLMLDDYQKGFIETNIKDFNFTLTPLALAEGYTSLDLDYLIKTWSESAFIDLKFQQYNKSLKSFNVLLLSLLFSCWFFISYTFFSGFLDIQLLGFPFFTRTFMKPICSELLRKPREAYRINEGRHMNNVKVATKNAVSPGHPVVGEKEGNNLRVDAALTHNPPTGLPSIPLGNAGIPPDPNVIYAVPIPGGSVLIPLSHFHPHAIPNSGAFLESAAVKPLLEKACNPTDENN